MMYVKGATDRVGARNTAVQQTYLLNSPVYTSLCCLRGDTEYLHSGTLLHCAQKILADLVSSNSQHSTIVSGYCESYEGDMFRLASFVIGLRAARAALRAHESQYQPGLAGVNNRALLSMQDLVRQSRSERKEVDQGPVRKFEIQRNAFGSCVRKHDELHRREV